MSDSQKPHVSVIMPAYNAGRYIGASIQSVLDQTYPDWELLLIDDASTDETPQVVAGFTDPRIRYQRVEHIGSPAGVRNVGLKLAQGEYIGFLDADDLYYPDALARLVTILDSHPRYSVVHGFSTHINEAGEALTHNWQLRPRDDGGFDLPSGYRFTWENVLLGHIMCTLPAYLVRKSAVERIGLFDEGLYGPEDFQFIMRLFLERENGVYCLPAYVYQYRIHTQSLTKSPAHAERLINSHLRIMNWLYSLPNLPPIVHTMHSRACVEGYHYLAREWLIHGQPDLARQIMEAAWHNRDIKRLDWLKRCLQIIVRSYLPTGLNSGLIAVKNLWRQRHVVSSLKQRWVTGRAFPTRCLGLLVSSGEGR